MPIASVSDLIECLTRYRLLEPVQRDELDLVLRARFTDPRTLARELVLREWLTPYQVNHIFQGNPNDLVLGSYVLLERLTESGLGQLFKARHLHMKRTVALQVVRPELLKDPRAVERFYGEIQAVSQLSNQHLVAAYDAGPIADTHFFAMEYVEGIDLERQIQQGGPLAVDQACEYVRQTALGLQHAFERGLLHHDLRPANLLVTRNGERGARGAGESSSSFDTRNGPVIKVRNLGLTLIRQHTKNTRLLVGAAEDDQPPPDYLAPERAAGGRGDVRSELYSLGGTFYFLLTGQVPFSGGSAEEKVRRHQAETPAPVEALRPEVPPPVAALVARLLAKDPAQRLALPREVAEFLSPEPVAETAAQTLAAAPKGPSPVRRRPRRGLVLAGAVLAAGLCLAVFLLARSRSNPGKATGSEEPVLIDPFVVVPANRPWHDTHIDLAAGDVVALLAEGWWRGGSRKAGCSPEGDRTQPADRTVLRDANPMALIGWVGGADAPFVIGVRKVYTAKTGGRLFVQANDLDLKDNTGEVHLQIKGGQPNPTPAAAWQVGYGKFDLKTKRVENFLPLPFWPQAGRWQPGREMPFQQFGYLGIARGDAGHPGPKPEFSLVRRWQAPRDGVIAFSGTLNHPQEGGDGVRARLISSRLGELAKPWIAHHAKVETNVARVEVRRGDALDAIVDNRRTDAHDSYIWMFTVRWGEGP